jgi:hypothetical protein
MGGMDLLGTGINAVVVGVVGLLLAWYMRGRFEAVDRRLDRLEDRIESVRSELSARLDLHLDRHAG